MPLTELVAHFGDYQKKNRVKLMSHGCSLNKFIEKTRAFQVCADYGSWGTCHQKQEQVAQAQDAWEKQVST